MGYGLTVSLWDRLSSHALLSALLSLGLAAPVARADPAESAAESASPAVARSAFVYSIDCPELTSERSAEVEARARAVLITSAVQANEATLTCDLETVSVLVIAGESSARITAPKTGAGLNDLLIDTFERALSRLSDRRVSDAAPLPAVEPGGVAGAPAERGASPPLTLALAPPSPRPLGRALPPSSEHHSSSRTAPVARYGADVAFGAALESWNGDAVLGPLVDASYGTRRLSVGLRLGGLFPLHSAAAFRAFELSATLAVRWQPTWSAGVRLVLGAGVSSLSARRREPYEPRGGTRVGAGLVDVSLGRPFGFGAWALSPELGVRLFTANRSVTADQATELELPRAAPHWAVTISRRFE